MTSLFCIIFIFFYSRIVKMWILPNSIFMVSFIYVKILDPSGIQDVKSSSLPTPITSGHHLVNNYLFPTILKCCLYHVLSSRLNLGLFLKLVVHLSVSSSIIFNFVWVVLTSDEVTPLVTLPFQSARGENRWVIGADESASETEPSLRGVRSLWSLVYVINTSIKVKKDERIMQHHHKISCLLWCQGLHKGPLT